jgi:hypothetical protein
MIMRTRVCLLLYLVTAVNIVSVLQAYEYFLHTHFC